MSELKQSEARRERERKVRHGSLDAGKAEPWLWRRPWTRARACASRLPCSGVRMWPRWRPGRRRDGDRRAFARSLPSSPLSARSTGPVGALPAPPGPPAGPARAPRERKDDLPRRRPSDAISVGLFDLTSFFPSVLFSRYVWGAPQKHDDGPTNFRRVQRVRREVLR